MLYEDTFATLASIGKSEIRINSSRFLGFAYPVASVEQVKVLLSTLKKEHAQANHHCYAFRLTTDPTGFRCSDDREPSGSAGKPILGAINSAGITYALVVVVRYFGGTQLGIPGLIQAYRESARTAIAEAGIKEDFIRDQYLFKFPYEQLNEVYRIIRATGAKIIGQELDEPSSIHVEIRHGSSQELLNAIHTHPLLGHLCRVEIPTNGTS